MKITETGFEGLYIIQPKVFSDSRGYFFESFKLETFLMSGIPFNPVQDNESRSVKGVIRGLHYQLNPFAQAKLIRVVVGKIYDVAVDLRRNSKTFGKWFGVILDSENKTQLFIPKGFAHGFSVLSDIAVIQYKCDNLYNPQYERGISLDDPDLAINWRIEGIEPVISPKDQKQPFFREAEMNF
ncbi:MAG: dTDP-4-dehydrorhamnose 3,5-epimerase [Bacteroidales bacterium]|jgi:dTDP-4-dehydrorhamnose 3,5-epimerase|nr:dTDP-4-dehydrorhamnose 3,5-epimerase [Bacteroidales bacterium]MDI9552390.1 dTDP-4-dehydrorhamnose 3,5-epimerase [Bacteroidota bacterium]MBP7038188.1 dTDP-4-dehydrorhamnose 3,5-epimerase [Bacteroidales bacterium]NLK54434.1 dTDP-4-dehydrorhamnose 3,5-epimerase [Bacteroidales bacterium]HPB12951.1 dTDP-4-dehydrorhamnose 3,5-epimerase [Bacteroidales bacterium]